MTAYELYGLVVEAPFALPATETSAAPDVVVRWGDEREVPPLAPPGAVLLDAVVDGRRLHSLSRTEDGAHHYRIPPVCEAEIAADLRTVQVHVGTGGSRGLASVLVTGAILSVVLELRGHLVLHGSGVVMDDRAVGIVGDRGMGKSTVAAMLCEAGAELLTDDVLRVDLDEEGVTAARGSAELRLRASAASLAERLGATRTPDGRFGVRRAGASVATHTPLSCIVVPAPQHGLDRVEVRHVATAEALFGLLRFPRLPGWQDVDREARHFQQLAELVERVPVVVLDVPWSDDFPLAASRRVAETVAAL